MQRYINDQQYGATRQALTKGMILDFEVPLPHLDVQRRIVAKLDDLLAQSRAARERLEAVPDLVEKYRQSVLAAAFRGDLTADWRKKNPDVEPASKLLERIRVERRKAWEAAELAKMKAKGKVPKDDKWKAKYEEPEPVDTSGLPELPPSWCWAALGQVCTIKGGITLGKKRSASDRVRQVPYLRVANVQRGRLELDEMKLIAETEDEIDDLRLRAGDVLFNEGGDRDKLGRGWVWEAQVPDCIHQNHVFRARPLDAALGPALKQRAPDNDASADLPASRTMKRSRNFSTGP
jgi:type I restriction enzyme S subunit